MAEEERELLTEDELLEKQQELEAREAELNRKESKLQKVEEKITKAKYGIYDRIDVSLKTMDKVVMVIGILLVICIFIGIFWQ